MDLSSEGQAKLQDMVDEINDARGESDRQTRDAASLRVARICFSCSAAEAVLIAEEAVNKDMSLSEYIRWLFFDHAKIRRRPHANKALSKLSLQVKQRVRGSIHHSGVREFNKKKVDA
jgi:hypothetical protein